MLHTSVFRQDAHSSRRHANFCSTSTTVNTGFMEHCLYMLLQYCLPGSIVRISRIVSQVANPNSSTSSKTRALVEDFSKMTSLRPNSASPSGVSELTVEICEWLANSVVFEFDHFGRPRFQNMVWNDAKDPYRLSKPARQFGMQVHELPWKWWWVRLILLVHPCCPFLKGLWRSQSSRSFENHPEASPAWSAINAKASHANHIH